MVYYRALFDDLLGHPADAWPGSAATNPEQIAGDAASKNGDAHAGGTQHIMTGDDPVADPPGKNGR
jgi:hypothetical protein